jgi:dethiobiotin synthetase
MPASATLPRRRDVFIAGTDTGIGKTHASVSLLHALRASGRSACGMKPVASGCEATPEGLRNEDALALQAASAPRPGYAAVNPVALTEPVSPHLAARTDGVQADLAGLDAGFRALQARYDSVVVEGVGGWMVPLGEDWLASELPRRFGLPVILVVGLRLGCLNHAMLSARAIQSDGCTLLGWIGNHIDPDMDRPEDNLATLRQWLPAPCLGVLDHGQVPSVAAARLQAAVAALG